MINAFSQFDMAVSRMINRFGGKGTLRVYSEGSYVDGEVTRTSTDYNINLALLDYPQNNSGDKSNFGTLILEGDKQCFIQPLDKVVCCELNQPAIKANRDTIIINGVEWKILALKEVNTSASNTVLFDAHLRK